MTDYKAKFTELTKLRQKELKETKKTIADLQSQLSQKSSRLDALTQKNASMKLQLDQMAARMNKTGFTGEIESAASRRASIISPIKLERDPELVGANSAAPIEETPETSGKEASVSTAADTSTEISSNNALEGSEEVAVANDLPDIASDAVANAMVEAERESETETGKAAPPPADDSANAVEVEDKESSVETSKGPYVASSTVSSLQRNNGKGEEIDESVVVGSIESKKAQTLSAEIEVLAREKENLQQQVADLTSRTLRLNEELATALAEKNKARKELILRVDEMHSLHDVKDALEIEVAKLSRAKKAISASIESIQSLSSAGSRAAVSGESGAGDSGVLASAATQPPPPVPAKQDDSSAASIGGGGGCWGLSWFRSKSNEVVVTDASSSNATPRISTDADLHTLPTAQPGTPSRQAAATASAGAASNLPPASPKEVAVDFVSTVFTSVLSSKLNPSPPPLPLAPFPAGKCDINSRSESSDMEGGEGFINLGSDCNELSDIDGDGHVIGRALSGGGTFTPTPTYQQPYSALQSLSALSGESGYTTASMSSPTAGAGGASDGAIGGGEGEGRREMKRMVTKGDWSATESEDELGTSAPPAIVRSKFAAAHGKISVEALLSTSSINNNINNNNGVRSRSSSRPTSRPTSLARAQTGSSATNKGAIQALPSESLLVESPGERLGEGKGQGQGQRSMHQQDINVLAALLEIDDADSTSAMPGKVKELIDQLEKYKGEAAANAAALSALEKKAAAESASSVQTVSLSEFTGVQMENQRLKADLKLQASRAKSLQTQGKDASAYVAVLQSFLKEKGIEDYPSNAPPPETSKSTIRARGSRGSVSGPSSSSTSSASLVNNVSSLDTSGAVSNPGLLSPNGKLPTKAGGSRRDSAGTPIPSSRSNASTPLPASTPTPGSKQMGASGSTPSSARRASTATPTPTSTPAAAGGTAFTATGAGASSGAKRKQSIKTPAGQQRKGSVSATTSGGSSSSSSSSAVSNSTTASAAMTPIEGGVKKASGAPTSAGKALSTSRKSNASPAPTPSPSARKSPLSSTKKAPSTAAVATAVDTAVADVNPSGEDEGAAAEVSSTGNFAVPDVVDAVVSNWEENGSNPATETITVGTESVLPLCTEALASSDQVTEAAADSGADVPDDANGAKEGGVVDSSVACDGSAGETNAIEGSDGANIAERAIGDDEEAPDTTETKEEEEEEEVEERSSAVDAADIDLPVDENKQKRDEVEEEDDGKIVAEPEVEEEEHQRAAPSVAAAVAAAEAASEGKGDAQDDAEVVDADGDAFTATERESESMAMEAMEEDGGEPIDTVGAVADKLETETKKSVELETPTSAASAASLSPTVNVDPTPADADADAIPDAPPADFGSDTAAFLTEDGGDGDVQEEAGNVEANYEQAAVEKVTEKEEQKEEEEGLGDGMMRDNDSIDGDAEKKEGEKEKEVEVNKGPLEVFESQRIVGDETGIVSMSMSMAMPFPEPVSEKREGEGHAAGMDRTAKDDINAEERGGNFWGEGEVVEEKEEDGAVREKVEMEAVKEQQEIDLEDPDVAAAAQSIQRGWKKRGGSAEFTPPISIPSPVPVPGFFDTSASEVDEGK